MAAAVPNKIVLKSTTAISLNDRFSHLQPSVNPVQTMRAENLRMQQASAKNRRLAQQMANRPSVQAALRPMRQRLGVKGRLGRGNLRQMSNRGGQMMTRPRGQQQGQRTRGFITRGMGRGQLRQRQGAFQARGAGVTRFQRGGGFRFQRGGGRFQRGAGRGGVTGRGTSRGGRSFKGGQFRGRGSQRGRGRGASNPVSREQLDAQLDDYMGQAD